MAAFAPLSTLAAVIAGWIAWRTLAQRREADRRDQWWQRTQWAIDLAMERDFSRAVVGLVTLKHLAASDLCTDEDYEMLDKIGGAKIDALTLSEESASRPTAIRAQRRATPLGRSTQVPPGPGTAQPGPTSSRFISTPVASGSSPPRPAWRKSLAEADRLVSFVAIAASRPSRRRIVRGQLLRQQVSWRHG